MQHCQPIPVPHGLYRSAGDLSWSVIRIPLEPRQPVDFAPRFSFARVLCCSTSYTSILMTRWTPIPTLTRGGRRRWPSSIFSDCWNDTVSTRHSRPRKRSRTSPPTAPTPSTLSSVLLVHTVSLQPCGALCRHFTFTESRSLMMLASRSAIDSAAVHRTAAGRIQVVDKQTLARQQTWLVGEQRLRIRVISM
jgi:hypothetical protein